MQEALHLVTMEMIPSTKDGDAYLLLGLSIALPDQLPCRERGGMLLVNDTQGTQTQPELQCRKEENTSQHTLLLG